MPCRPYCITRSLRTALTRIALQDSAEHRNQLHTAVHIPCQSFKDWTPNRARALMPPYVLSVIFHTLSNIVDALCYKPKFRGVESR
jgi:hypothetical protein